MGSSHHRLKTAIVHAGAIVALLAGFAAASPVAAQTVASQRAAEVPIGHRQPNAGDVPADVLRRQQMIDAQDRELDKRLNICRGC
jgi:hypothetical protein